MITAAVVCVVIIFLLTFFSNTIMNYSLPKVSSQYPSWAIISTSNKSTGTIEASVIEEVKAFDSRKVTGVYVYEYNMVTAGDVLMTLEPAVESDELKMLQDQLEEIELRRYYEGKLPVNKPDYTYMEEAIAEALTVYNQSKVDLSKSKNKSSIITTAQNTIYESITLIIT